MRISILLRNQNSMDIAKLKKEKFLTRKTLTASLIGFFILMAAIIVLQPHGDIRVERNKILVGKVTRGSFTVTVDGYGLLRSDKQTLITALTIATVSEIYLRSGAKVEAGTLILRLDNPELLQEVDKAKRALEQEKANLRSLILNNQRELLAEQAALAELTANLKAVQLRSEAEKNLAGGAVSMLAYKTTLLQQELMTQRVELETQREHQLKEVMREAVIIQQEQINQMSAAYQNIRERADRLWVRAPQKGVLQQMPLELGQSIAPGQELALIGSDRDLKALIRVSQSKADQLKIGQAATINTRREQVAAFVTRIAPEVHDGSIEVELTFNETIPASARPELSIDARIVTANLTNVLFMDRPINSQTHSSMQLFKLDQNQATAMRQPIQFGEESDRFIQIEGGAQESDYFIISDTTNLQSAKKLKIIN